MIQKPRRQLTTFFHTADSECAERAPFRGPPLLGPSDPEFASVVGDYGPGSTPEQRALRVRLAETRRLLRAYG
jgi:hypothetical protein